MDPTKVGFIYPILYLFYKANATELEFNQGETGGENKDAVLVANSLVDTMTLFGKNGMDGKATGILNIRKDIKTESEPNLDNVISKLEREQKQTKPGTSQYNYFGGLIQFFTRIKEEIQTK